MYQRILVATDDSRLSRKTVKSAIALATALQAELVIAHVVPRYPSAYFEGAVVLPPADVQRIEDEWMQKGRSVVDAAVRAAGAAGVRARAAVLQSDSVADALLGAVKKHRCDLIVMASHGRRGLQRLLLGSETQHVLTRGQTPVLVLR